MKKASSCVSNRLLANLLLNYEDQIIINKSCYWGKEDNSNVKKHYIEFESDKLPHEGENGHLDIIVESYYDLKFKSDRDV